MTSAVDGPLGFVVLPPVGWALAAVFGALWGSFLNVCIHRVGLYESVVHPRSRCPRCGSAIAGYDNVPILSWLWLGGRCRHCRAPISIRYPLVELLSLFSAVGVYARFVVGAEAGPGHAAARFLVYFAFVGTLLVLGGIDLDHRLIPDRITYPAIPIFLGAAVLLGELPREELVLGGVMGYGVVAVVAELAYLVLGREGMGYGDAKLLALVGVVLGWRGVVFTFFAAPWVGLLVVLPLRALRRQRLLGVEIPYGPFLIAGALGYLFAGHLLPRPLTFFAP